jgi:hypothetical protein
MIKSFCLISLSVGQMVLAFTFLAQLTQRVKRGFAIAYIWVCNEYCMNYFKNIFLWNNWAN